MLEEVLSVLYEDLLRLGLILLQFDLNLWAVGEGARLVCLHLELAAGARYYKGLVYGTYYLRAVERSIAELFKALVFLYFLGAHSIGLRSGVACTA